MKEKTKRAGRTGVVLALGLSACGVDHSIRPGPTPPTTVDSRAESAALDAVVQQSLERLNALQLFTVEQLVLKLPANATDCYGVPCPGDTAGRAAYNAELARQAGRLSKLADQAESCNSGNCYVFTPDSAEQALQALNALEIVQVGALVQSQPTNNPSCYNLPCAEDLEAAKQENRRREVAAFTLARYARGF